MEKKQLLSMLLVFAVGVFIGIGVEEYREHAGASAEHALTVANTIEGMQLYAHPAWGVSIQFPFGYVPRLVQEYEGTLGVQIENETRQAEERSSNVEECVACAVHISVVKNFLRDEPGVMKDPEEYRANQERQGNQYTETQFAGHPALARTDTETGRRDYSIFVQTEVGYDWYRVGVQVDDPMAEEIAATFALAPGR